MVDIEAAVSNESNCCSSRPVHFATHVDEDSERGGSVSDHNALESVELCVCMFEGSSGF